MGGVIQQTVTTHSDRGVETSKTDKSDSIDNEVFLRAIFKDRPDGTRPILVDFPGDPGKAPGKSWRGRPMPEENVAWFPDYNNYFSVAAFHPDKNGRYRRRKPQFAGLFAVMLDDLGTKVQEELSVKPTWEIETSPGNFQVGYALQEAITDPNIADRLMEAIIDAGLCDPGANGPTARLARLPVAVNGKHTPAFTCRLSEWSPERRYTMQELIDGLELTLPPETSNATRATAGTKSKMAANASVWQPSPATNPVINALQDRHLYKADLSDGKHDITCPWVGEHTDRIDRGTAYFEPSEDWPIGGFKCLHGHCSHRALTDLLTFLQVPLSAARMKPQVTIVQGELDRIVGAAEMILTQRGSCYQRGGMIVQVGRDPTSRETSIMELTKSGLTLLLAGAATWVRFDTRKQVDVEADPPSRHVAVLYDAQQYRHLPVLTGVARQPFLRTDGSLVLVSGYDQETGMLGVFDPSQYAVPDAPTRAEAEAALCCLRDLLNEFCFAGEEDLSAALSAIVTAAIRPALEVAPMFHVQASSPGSGKSYLCELIAAFASEQRGMPMQFPRHDEECTKLLIAEFMRGPAVIEFDNLTSDLVPHKSLCTALTSSFMKGRILGASRTVTVPTRALVLSSGNNVGPVEDMTRRCVTIDLAPKEEIPAQRAFNRPDLVGDVLSIRGEAVSAALVIVRAWIVAGRPRSPVKSLAGFTQWNDLCRQSLLWLGMPDPVERLFSRIASDPAREQMARLFHAWHQACGASPVKVREVVKTAKALGGQSDLHEVLDEVAGSREGINNRRLGWWLKRHEGRKVDGLHLSRAPGSRSVEHWSVAA